MGEIGWVLILMFFHYGKIYVNGLFSNSAILCFSMLENNRGMKVDWLKSEMDKRSLSQRDVAGAVGLSDAQMSKVLNGTRKLSATEADAIRRYLGYTLPDDVASELDIRLLHALSRMTEQEKAALEVLLNSLRSPSP